MRYEDVVLTPLPSHRFKLRKPLRFKWVEVPEGFRTDGASVPRLFWWLFPPNRTDYLPCAIIHDFLCDKGEYEKADRLLKECMKNLGISKITVHIFYYAVRIYHITKEFFVHAKRRLSI